MDKRFAATVPEEGQQKTIWVSGPDSPLMQEQSGTQVEDTTEVDHWLGQWVYSQKLVVVVIVMVPPGFQLRRCTRVGTEVVTLLPIVVLVFLIRRDNIAEARRIH